MAVVRTEPVEFQSAAVDLVIELFGDIGHVGRLVELVADVYKRQEGNKVNLPGIDFVKIQNATLQDLGYGYGPACVLFNCAIDLHLAGKEIETIAQ